MTPADTARFQLALRAYRAAEPRELEVQAGVRRARLSVRRPKARRAWFARGALVAVLAMGSLAYAKPAAFQGWVSRALGLSAPPPATSRPGPVGVAPSVAPIPVANGETGLALRVDALSPPTHTPSWTPDRPAGFGASPIASPGGPRSALAAKPSMVPAAPEPAVSPWGRVGRALAKGDDDAALAALNALSQSADDSTRDKADLGRAQLYMARGDRDAACALARALTHRRAGGRIERQAQLLLHDCAP